MNHKAILKHLLSTVLCAAVALICLFGLTVNAQAAEIVESGTCGNNATWTIDSEGTLTISGNGAITDSTWDSSSVNSVVIRSGITSIGEAVFWDCSNLVSVIIGNSVVSIGEWAFSDLGNLTSVTMGNSVISIGEGAFDNCECLTSIMLPESVISIGSSAFFDCSSLTSITIPDSVTNIGVSAFSGCRNLTSVTIGKSVTSIGDYVFYNCSRLSSITIPDSVTSIGECAFSECKGLTSVTIGNSVANIGECAFYNCNGLNSIIIPDKVTHISKRAFMNCSSLVSVTIGNGVTSIGYQAFDTCESLTTITIPDSVTSIGECAFSECKGLTSVTIGNSVASIGEYAFDCCDNLKEIYFEGDAPSIGSFAFYDVTATAYYPAHNSTWIGSVRNNYGGTITWVALGHSYTSVVVAPTCTKGGYTTFTCSVCGDGYVGDHTATLDHTYEEGVCSVCGDLTLFLKNQPITKFVKDGSTANFSVNAIGNELVYQWQYRTSSSGSWKNAKATGNTTATLSVPASVSRSGYQYRCVVTDSNGNKINSKAVYLYVLGIKTQPVTQKVKDGTTAKFTVSATGAGKTYQWQYRTSSSGSWKNAKATGNTTATLSVPASVSRHGYQYRCRVTDGAGNKVYTKTVTLNVLGIKTQPVNKTVVADKTAKFTVAATGNGLKYQWQYRTSSSGSWKSASATGNKTKTLSVPASVSRHGYQYRCKITDSAGNVIYTKAVSLYVLGIKTQPVNKTVKVGATAKFTVKATGKGLTYQWQYKTSDGSWKNVSASSGKTASYSLTAAARHNGYQYRCRIKDSSGNVIYSKTVKLTVK